MSLIILKPSCGHVIHIICPMDALILKGEILKLFSVWIQNKNLWHSKLVGDQQSVADQNYTLITIFCSNWDLGNFQTGSLSLSQFQKMASSVSISTLLPHSSSLTKTKLSDVNPRICFLANNNNPNKPLLSSHLSTFHSQVFINRNDGSHTHLSPRAALSSSGKTKTITE